MYSLFFYIIFFIFVFALNIIGSNYYNSNNKRIIGKFFISFSFILMLFLVGLRYKVGTDYDSYLKIYDTIKNLDWSRLDLLSWEYGSIVIFKISSYFLFNSYLIFFVIGFITLYPIYKANKLLDYKYLAYSILTFCCLYLPFCLNGMRQGMAMSIILYGFVLLMLNHKRGILYIIISILIHKSSVLFLPFMILYLFEKNNFKKYSIILTVLLSIFILFFLKNILIDNDISYYSSYLNNVNTESISFKIIIFYIPIILISVLYTKANSVSNIYSGLFYSGIVFEIIGSSARYMNRIALYLNLFQIIFIPYIISKIENKNTKMIIKIFYIIYLITYFIFQFYVKNKNEIFPYQIWLFKGGI